MGDLRQQAGVGQQRDPRMKLWVAARIIIFILLLFSHTASAQADKSTIESIASSLRLGNFDAALQVLEPCLRRFPNDARLWAMDGVALSALRQNNKALGAYRHALKIAPDYLPALEGAAQIEYEAGDKDVALTLRHILKLRPDNPTSHAMLGVLAYKRGDCSEAVLHFGQSGATVESQPAAMQQYSACLVKLHRLDDAVGVARRLVDLNPEDSQSRSRLASLQLMGEHPKEAIATLQPLLESHPDTHILELAAAAFEADGDTPEAERTLREAMLRDPGSVDLYIDFASLAFDHQSFAAGIEMLNSGLRTHPDTAALYLERGILYVQIADYEKAEADFEKASQLDPRQFFSVVARGKVAEQNGDFDKALAAVQKGLAKKPTDAFLLYTRADILLQKGIEPGTTDFRTALDSARKAVELDPALVLARDILGSLYLQEGQYQLAIKQSRRALEYDSKDQTALYHLIIALRKTGGAKELPELLKRLAQLRQEASKEQIIRSGENGEALK